MAKWSLVVGISLSAGLSTVAGIGNVEAGQVTVFVNYVGVGCNVCGVQDYAFPGSAAWNDGNATFADPLPAGAIPVQMVATAQGICDGDASVLVDGTLLGTTSFIGTSCACELCADGTPASSATFDGGWPGYVAGGANTLQLQTVGGPVYDGVNLTIVYRLCGDSVTDGGEACDTGGDSATCDADCTAPACGDSHVNLAAGEACDEGVESASCDADCSPATCGDGHVNGAAGEVCDVSVENAACDADCTLADCGDGHINAAAGESCDDANDVDGDGCSTLCQVEGGPTSGSTGEGTGGDGPGAGTGGDGGAGPSGPTGPTGGPTGPTATGGPTGPTGSGIAVVTGVGHGGGDGDGDGSAGDGGSEGGARGDAGSGSGNAAGCGCEVPAPDQGPFGRVAAIAAFIAAAFWRLSARRRS